MNVERGFVMSSLLSLLPEGGWQRLMCDALWQSTLIAGIGLLAARFAVRQSAARAWLLLLTLTACVLVPLASAAARQQGWGLLAGVSDAPTMISERQQASASAIAEFPSMHHDAVSTGSLVSGTPEFSGPSDSSDTTALSMPTSPEGIGKPFPKSASPHPTVAMQNGSRPFDASLPKPIDLLGMAWLAASVFFSVRLGLSAIATRRLLRRACACQDALLLAAAAEAASRTGWRKQPIVLTSDLIQTPTVFCLGRPRLLVPASATKSATTINWPAAFTHELAHAARSDGWSRLWVELVTIALPMSPLIWLARRAFYRSCEESCDDWAVATGTSPIDLAETLTAWITCQKPSTALAIGMSSTKSRTLRLLALRDKPAFSLGFARRWSGIVFAVVSIAGLAAAQTNVKREDAKAAPATSAASAAAKMSVDSPEDAVAKAIEEDGLIAVYNDRIEYPYEKETFEDAQRELDAVKAGKSQADEQKQSKLRDQIKAYNKLVKEFKDRIEKRKAELRARITEQLREEQSVAAPERREPIAADVVRAGDMVVITPMERLIPKQPPTIAAFDRVNLEAINVKPEQPIKGTFTVDSSGEIVLGAGYGTVKVAGLMRREAEGAVKTKLQQLLINPEVAITIPETEERWVATADLRNGRKIDENGQLSLGPFGKITLGGLTEAEAKAAIKRRLSYYFRDPDVDITIQGPGQRAPTRLIQPDHANAQARDAKLPERARIPDDIAERALRQNETYAELQKALSTYKAILDRATSASKNPSRDPDVKRYTATIAGIEAQLKILRSELEPKTFKLLQSDQANALPRDVTERSTQKAPAVSDPGTLPPYTIAPPDILLIDAQRIIPKDFHIEPLDVLKVEVDGTKSDAPIRGLYLVEPGGTLDLGAGYGKVKVRGLSLEESAEAATRHLKRILADPQVSISLNESGGQQQIRGQHLVAPDGTVNLGTYGQVYVAGLTVPEATTAIEKHLAKYLESPEVSVDVHSYNSKVYYVITEGDAGDNI